MLGSGNSSFEDLFAIFIFTRFQTFKFTFQLLKVLCKMYCSVPEKDSEECADRNREVIVRDILKKVKSKEFNISLSARERGDIALRAAQLLNEMI